MALSIHHDRNRKLEIQNHKRSSRPRKSWDEVIKNDRKKLDMDSADPQNRSECIRITCPCNEHPLTPHFYIEKVGFTRVYIFFLFLLQNIDCGYSLEPPR